MGRKAEDGSIPAKYQLQEMPTADYLARTEANVVDSDCTVLFTNGELWGGSVRTKDFAKKHHRPWLHVDLATADRAAAVNSIVKWVEVSCPANVVLNVAGSRASKASGLEQAVLVRMVDVLIAVNPDCRKFYPLGEEG